MQKLPIGLNSLRKIRELNCLYVDKTKYAYNLITGGWRYFLSRPRRFGKSLFVSTLHEILLGNAELLQDLWIGKSDYQWKKHGVIMLSLSSLDTKNIDLFEKSLCDVLQKIAEEYSIESINFDRTPKSVFIDLITALHKKYGGVAILVDEYDYPILRTLDDHSLAFQIRDALRDFFIIIKDLDKYINFVFITGVSSFAKTGIFSGLNNLQTITLNENYSDILGYTEEEVDTYFTSYIKNWSEKKAVPFQELRYDIKTWYNGYCFNNNGPSVYNPFSVMNALVAQEFDNFWIQSGTPSFLLQELNKEYRNKEFRVFDIETIKLSKDDLGTIDVGAIPLPTLLFQTGYVTIDTYDKDARLYKLKFPNYEVKQSFQKLLFTIIAQADPIASLHIIQEIISALNQMDIQKALDILKQLFSRIPYQIHAPQEKFYHAILQIIFDIAGVKIQSEYSTSQGRIDLVLELQKQLYVIEVKFNATPEKALAQIEDRQYWEPFLQHKKPIILLGLSFERKPGKFNITYAAKELDT